MNKLLETLLRSEFKFGFELEGYVGKSILHNYLMYDDEPNYEENDENFDEDFFDGYTSDNYSGLPDIDTDKLYEDLTEYFQNYFGKDIEVTQDGSLNELNGGFEFPTPPMNLTPLNVKKCIDFLYSLKNDKFEIYTDNSCGFHTHISFPNMSNKDMVWIICNIALDSNLIDNLLHFTSLNQNFDFFGKWATTDFLYNIQNNIKDENWNELNKLLTNEKYRVIRIHPQGTLEWRGPRNFLDEGNLQIIKDFFIKLLKIVTEISNIMDKKEINNISKENFFKLIDISELEQKPIQGSINESVFDAIIKNPLILTKIKNDYTSISWVKFAKHLYNKVTEQGIYFENFLTPLRYKKFNNNRLLAAIITVEPDFIYYINNSISKVLAAANNMVYNFWLHYLHKDPKLNNTLLSIYVDSNSTSVAGYISILLYRLKRNLPVNVFFNKKIIQSLADLKSTNLQRIYTKTINDNPDYKEYIEKLFKLIFYSF